MIGPAGFMMAPKQYEVEIMCIGIDNLQHTCLPHSDVCKCGIPVRRKKLMRDDYQLLSCYECTF